MGFIESCGRIWDWRLAKVGILLSQEHGPSWLRFCLTSGDVRAGSRRGKSVESRGIGPREAALAREIFKAGLSCTEVRWFGFSVGWNICATRTHHCASEGLEVTIVDKPKRFSFSRRAEKCRISASKRGACRCCRWPPGANDLKPGKPGRS